MIKTIIITIILYAIITGARRPEAVTETYHGLLYAIDVHGIIKPYKAILGTFLHNPYKYTLNTEKAVFGTFKRFTRLCYKIVYYYGLTTPTAENVKNRRNYSGSAPHNFDIKCQNFNIFIYAKNLVCVSFFRKCQPLDRGGFYIEKFSKNFFKKIFGCVSRFQNIRIDLTGVIL